MTSPISLQLCQLSAAVEQHVLFRQLDCTLQSGELLRVSGRNGSGKTTLLRILAGLNSHYDGDLLWCDENIRSNPYDYAQQLLYLGHQPALKMQLTAQENLAWYASCVGARSAEIQTALELLGIAHKAHLPCRQLSAGQQRRVVLARLFFSPQKLWILDEPFTALDSHGFSLIVEKLQQHCHNGGMVILTTHHGSDSIGLPQRELSLDATSLQETAT